jgi:predicted enzyme involved in methoxymalonyl-ACP biosynthesis
MSCRVLNRTAEHFLMNKIFQQATQKNFKRIIGEYMPTAKNRIVADIFVDFGFKQIIQKNDSLLYETAIPVPKMKTFVKFYQ